MSEPVSTDTVFGQRYRVDREIGRGGVSDGCRRVATSYVSEQPKLTKLP